MAYVTGSATSFADLLAAIQAACTANGWTLTGNVLNIGSCYVQLSVVGNAIDVVGGTGISGSALTGATSRSARLQNVKGIAITFPVTYQVHVNTSPDEVYVVINYNITRYGWLAFGQSGVEGLPGSGNWFGAICSSSNGSSGVAIGPAGAQSSGTTTTSASIGFLTSASGTPGNSADPQNFRVHHGFDGNQWSSAGDDVGSDVGEASTWNGGCARALVAPALAPLLARQPNAWNGEAILLPIQAFVARPSGKVSMVTDFAHARLLRIDNYAPEDLITLGSDVWKVYPWHMKNADSRDGGDAVDHSGTLGWAVRYTGP